MLPSFKSLTPRKILKWTILTTTVIIIGTTLSYAIVSINALGRTYDDTAQIPHRPVALLLGTSPVTRQGEHNNYFDTRIKACAQLYHAGKIDRIIASGGNYQGKQRWGCNELQAMHDSLVCRGIPDSIITLDYHGLRTLSSIQNTKAMGIDSITIISQHYHNERALLLADHNDIDAIAYTRTNLQHIARHQLGSLVVCQNRALKDKIIRCITSRHTLGCMEFSHITF